MTEFFGHKNLLITQGKIGQNCTLFSKPRVCQSLLNMPNPAQPLAGLRSRNESEVFAWSQIPDNSRSRIYLSDPGCLIGLFFTSVS